MMEKHIEQAIFGQRRRTSMIRLDVDAMYLSSAVQAFSRAEKAASRITKAEIKRAKLHSELKQVSPTDEIPDDGEYEKVESISIALENAEYGVDEAYGPFLQDLATAQILSAAAAEAHINSRAKVLLEGRLWDAFERLSLDAKWLMLPVLKNIPAFKAGEELFQRLDRVVRYRNGLVHYKARKEPWMNEPPEFLNKLGLSLEAAEESISSIRSMIAELSKRLGERPPVWLDGKPGSFYNIQVEEYP
jgi:hypothetical protein